MSTQDFSPIRIVHSTMIELSWTESSLELFSHVLAQSGSCLLSALLAYDQQFETLLSTAGREAIQTLRSNGFQLLASWPRESTTAVADWLGERFFWLNPRAVSAVHHHRLCAVVSSQLGKDKHQLACWPSLLEWSIELAVRDQCALLVAQGTTFDSEARRFAHAARLSTLELAFPNSTRLSDENRKSKASKEVYESLNVAWLKARMKNALIYCSTFEPTFSTASGQVVSPHRDGRATGSQEAATGSQDSACVELSPTWRGPNETLEKSSTERDRASVALADRICCVWIRTGGKISQLVEKRLQDHRFPTASCFLALPYFVHAQEQDWNSQNAWLDRGAVGYVVQVDDWKSYTKSWLRCKKLPRSSQLADSPFHDGPAISSPQQFCLPVHRWLKKQTPETWIYLTHCTRGNSAAWPQESNDAYVRRVWNEGVTLTADPLAMLMHILQEGRLRGSNRLTRGGSPVVSLSQVPLMDLLQRRSFKRHLNRWDWEPYGFLFHRDVLPQAKPVVYGTEELYATLPSADRSLFQPLDGTQNWSQENEWRVLGDIDLRTLPACSVMVFTKTQAEARQLAWISPFPVVWIDGVGHKGSPNSANAAYRK